MITQPVPTLSQDTPKPRRSRQSARPLSLLRSNPGPAATSQNKPPVVSMPPSSMPAARSRTAGPAPAAGWARSRAGRGRCPRRRLVMSRYLPGISEHAPWRPCQLSRQAQAAASQVKGRHRIPVIHQAVSA